ncbi:uncharacterized protein MONBRDRAFT_22258 [Monosiga brevicollis MX1]|uniref:Uncharacterized protein n=1 Tax=Monosiga brevicollis TaxID=81824 RepID=A9UQ16_MONBE|nr:uncharacterized protein MONBRDRAFT_22258 [Monosiga brevicollis MX1]EDQ92969.1 predicted protein [Monosiga brevicollis MX1]|eukprot:XP_001742731.1 hypothetical protein [Monosiga brevicollis MX1]
MAAGKGEHGGGSGGGRVPLEVPLEKGRDDEFADYFAKVEPSQQQLIMACRDRDGFSNFHKACILGLCRTVRLMLRCGAHVNEVNKLNWTPLFSSCSVNVDMDMVLLLLAAGADPNIKTVTQMAPLHMAMSNGPIELAEALLDAGANPNVTQEVGRLGPPSDGEATNAIIERPAYPYLLAQSGNTPLHILTWDNDGQVGERERQLYRLMISQGSDPLCEDVFGVFALHQCPAAARDIFVELGASVLRARLAVLWTVGELARDSGTRPDVDFPWEWVSRQELTERAVHQLNGRLEPGDD